MDTNHDGQLSRNEYRASQTGTSFDKADQNDDQAITRQEFSQQAAGSATTR